MSLLSKGYRTPGDLSFGGSGEVGKLSPPRIIKVIQKQKKKKGLLKRLLGKFFSKKVK